LLDFIKFVKDYQLLEEGEQVTIHATGGGAYKYHDLIDKEFQGKVKLNKYDEMQSLVDGMSFVLSCAKNSSYTHREGEGQKNVETNIASLDMSKTDQDSEYHEIFHICDSQSTDTAGGSRSKMLVSIGSGVSMIKVSNNGKFERVSGTMIGGGTLVGLSNLLTGIRDFDQIIELSQKGNNSGVDMLVKDIYGSKSPFKEL
jgi:pantothenate kinase